MFVMKSYLMPQIIRFSGFTISELLRENHEMGKNTLASPRLAIKCSEIPKTVDVGNANSQHEQIFVKYLCKISSQILQTFRCLEV